MKKGFTKQDFYNLLKPNGECLEWTGGVASNGYGMTWIFEKKNNVQAHRLALQLEGIDPGDGVVMHSCDNKLCCNPAHLSVGTQADNMKDMISKRRNATGERNGSAKLKQSQVFEIRKLYRAGWKQVELAEMFNVHQTTISLIVTNQNWQAH